ncbi:MAG: tetratricopeptide repeat protein [Runella sp.]
MFIKMPTQLPMKDSSKKVKYLFWALFLSSLMADNIYAQTNSTDSLKRLLTQPIPDSSRVLILDQLARSLMYSKPLVAMQYAQEGLTLAEKNKYSKGIARQMNRIGTILRITGNYPKSLEMHLSSLKVAEDNDDLDGMARTLNNIGNLYLEQKDLKRANEYFFKAKATARQINDENLIEISLNNIGSAYALNNQLDSARIYTQQAYEMALKHKSPNLNVMLMTLGNIHYRMGLLPLSLEYYRTSLPYSKKVEDTRILSQTYFEMAQVFRQAGNPDSCRHYAEKSLETGKIANNPKNIYDASLLLSELYEGRNDKQAHKYFKLAIATKDSLFNQEKVRQVQNLSFAEEIRQQEITNAKITAEKERQDNLQLIAIAVFIVLFFLVVVLLSRWRNYARITESLGLVALLLFFEFINLLMHPVIVHVTHHTPVYMLLLLVLMASILAPMHHYLTHWIKEKLIPRLPVRRGRKPLTAAKKHTGH